jgi:UDPglucose 6-dehydrogenase
MHIGIVGAGYVGLVTGVCLAEMGNAVTLADVAADKIAKLRAGKSPHFEPGLDELLSKNIGAGRLTFSTVTADAARDQDAVFLAVGTPMSETGEADLQYIFAAAETVARHLTRRAVVIIKSTVPVGTNAAVSAKIAALAPVEFAVISNPEFLKEGAAINDFMKPDRVVIGSRADWATDLMRQIYAPFVRGGHAIMVMDVESAEMVKYASNALLACRISFINEIAQLCERVGADVELVRRGVSADARIGGAFLYAGLGYGGSCFPKDVLALTMTAQKNGLAAPLCRAIDEVNRAQRLALLPPLEQHFHGDLRGKKFVVWGLAFKAQTDDVREAPAIYLIRELLKRGAEVAAYDPQGMTNAARELPSAVVFAKDSYEKVRGADALIVCTVWNEFRSPDFERIKKELTAPVIFDGRNLYDLALLRRLGFAYYSIGRQSVLGAINN